MIEQIRRGGETRFSLILLFIMGCIFWLPSAVINLRDQEMFFPLVGIALYLAVNIFFKVNRAAGATLAFVIVGVLCTFSPDAYSFFFTVTFFAYLYYTVVTNYEEIAKHRDLIFNLVCVFALLNVLWLILQANGIYIFFKPKIGSTLETGFFANRNEVSVFLAACLPFFFRRWWHFGIIPVFAGLVLAQTANGLIGAVIVMVLYSLVRGIKKGYSQKWLIIGAIVVAVAAVSSYWVFVHSGAVTERAAAFTKSLELVKERPAFGWGVNQGKHVIPLYLNGDRQDPRYVAYAYGKVLYQDNFKRAYLANPVRYTGDNKTWIRLHNDYLQWTIDMGLVGLAGLLWIVVSHGIAFFRTRSRDLLTGLSVLCLLWTANAFFTFQIGRFSFLIVFLLALIQGKYLTQRRVNT